MSSRKILHLRRPEIPAELKPFSVWLDPASPAWKTVLEGDHPAVLLVGALACLTVSDDEREAIRARPVLRAHLIERVLTHGEADWLKQGKRDLAQELEGFVRLAPRRTGLAASGARSLRRLGAELLGHALGPDMLDLVSLAGAPIARAQAAAFTADHLPKTAPAWVCETSWRSHAQREVGRASLHLAVTAAEKSASPAAILGSAALLLTVAPSALRPLRRRLAALVKEKTVAGFLLAERLPTNAIEHMEQLAAILLTGEGAAKPRIGAPKKRREMSGKGNAFYLKVKGTTGENWLETNLSDQELGVVREHLKREGLDLVNARTAQADGDPRAERLGEKLASKQAVAGHYQVRDLRDSPSAAPQAKTGKGAPRNAREIQRDLRDLRALQGE